MDSAMYGNTLGGPVSHWLVVHLGYKSVTPRVHYSVWEVDFSTTSPPRSLNSGQLQPLYCVQMS